MKNLSTHHGQCKFQKTFLRILYEVPAGLPAGERYFHADIPQMTGAQLRRELDRALQRLLLDQRPHAWLLERIDRLREALDHAH